MVLSDMSYAAIKLGAISIPEAKAGHATRRHFTIRDCTSAAWGNKTR